MAPVYTCPMHPEVSQPGPGSCPDCGMDLEPRTVAGGGEDLGRMRLDDGARIDDEDLAVVTEQVGVRPWSGVRTGIRRKEPLDHERLLNSAGT